MVLDCKVALKFSLITEQMKDVPLHHDVMLSAVEFCKEEVTSLDEFCFDPGDGASKGAAIPCKFQKANTVIATNIGATFLSIFAATVRYLSPGSQCHR